MQKVHCVDHQRDVGSVFARRVSELLLWNNRVLRQHIGPGLRPRVRKVAIDAADTCLTNLGYLLEQTIGDSSRGVVGIDKDGETWGASVRHEQIR